MSCGQSWPAPARGPASGSQALGLSGAGPPTFLAFRVAPLFLWSLPLLSFFMFPSAETVTGSGVMELDRGTRIEGTRHH